MYGVSRAPTPSRSSSALVGAPSLAPALAADLLGVQLAAEDLGAALVLPGGAGSPHVLVVACDVQPGLPNVSERTNRATRHLVEELEARLSPPLPEPSAATRPPRSPRLEPTSCSTRSKGRRNAPANASSRSRRAPPTDSRLSRPCSPGPSSRAVAPRARERACASPSSATRSTRRSSACWPSRSPSTENASRRPAATSCGWPRRAAERVLTFPAGCAAPRRPGGRARFVGTLVEASWGSEGAPPVWVAGASAASDAPPRAASLAPGRFHLLVPEAPGDARTVGQRSRRRARAVPDAPAPTSAASYDATVLAALSALRAPSARGRARLATLFAEARRNSTPSRSPRPWRRYGRRPRSTSGWWTARFDSTSTGSAFDS